MYEEELGLGGRDSRVLAARAQLDSANEQIAAIMAEARKQAEDAPVATPVEEVEMARRQAELARLQENRRALEADKARALALIESLRSEQSVAAARATEEAEAAADRLRSLVAQHQAEIAELRAAQEAALAERDAALAALTTDRDEALARVAALDDERAAAVAAQIRTGT